MKTYFFIAHSEAESFKKRSIELGCSVISENEEGLTSLLLVEGEGIEDLKKDYDENWLRYGKE